MSLIIWKKTKFVLNFWFVLLFMLSGCHSSTDIIDNPPPNLTSKISNLTISSLNSQIFITLVVDCNNENIIYCSGSLFSPNSAGISYSFEYSCNGQNTTFNFLAGSCDPSHLYRSNLYCLNLTNGTVFSILPEIATKDVECI